MTGQSKQGITCTHCGSDSFVKYGYRPAKDGKKTQRYRCNECKKTFVPVDGRKIINADIRKKIVFKREFCVDLQMAPDEGRKYSVLTVLFQGKYQAQKSLFGHSSGHRV